MDKLKAVAVWLSSKSGYILAALALATAAASAGASSGALVSCTSAEASAGALPDAAAEFA